MITDKKHPLVTPVQFVKGVGPALSEKLARMGIFTVSDLLSVVPIRYIDRRNILPISMLSPGKDRTIIGRVKASGIAFLGRRRKRIYEAIVEDETGRVSVKWFNFNQRYCEDKFKPGTKLLISGDVSLYQMVPQFIHPEIEFLTGDSDETAAKIIPIYPLTEGLYQKTMRKIIRNAWDAYNNFMEPVFPETLMEKFGLADPWNCLQELHFPSPDDDVNLLNIARSRAHKTLIFDEFFFLELGMALRRKKIATEPGFVFKKDEEGLRRFIKSLPFTLTNAQARVIKEIQDDMASERPMNRLLQGDVGSGKTVVALACALQAINSGYQAAIMAPTEILAEQHFETITKLVSPLGIPHGLLTSSTKGKDRERLYAELSNGEIPLIVGTHALIQEHVDFRNLGFIVVDEQHRFGVLQRAAIQKKGKGEKRPDVLIMTATPIPRTLAMTLYGDLDVSVIDEMPPGRRPVITRLYEEHQREKLYGGMRHELSQGRQVYVVYPLIEESEKLDLKNATAMKDELAKVFEPEFSTALLHGRMTGEQKESIMNEFKAGRIKVLVTTSVVEVGVDVPNASVMVIEHAERFGLSQLHQLRGRVGRSSHQSYCILMADYRRSEDARRRLAVMVETTDGFKIAEEDLSLRGPGEFIGTKQSGIPPFRVANLARDVRILSQAREAAFRIVEADPELAKPDNQMLKKTMAIRWAGRLDLAMVS
jgi:ATP-dependent DNA helicase RecG